MCSRLEERDGCVFFNCTEMVLLRLRLDPSETGRAGLLTFVASSCSSDSDFQTNVMTVLPLNSLSF